MSCMVTISEDGLVRSYKKRSKCIAIDTGDLVSTLVDYQCYSTVGYGTNSRVRVRDRDRIVVIISLQQEER